MDPVPDVDQVPDFLQLFLLLDVSSVEGQGQEVNGNAEDHDGGADHAELQEEIL